VEVSHLCKFISIVEKVNKLTKEKKMVLETRVFKVGLLFCFTKAVSWNTLGHARACRLKNETLKDLKKRCIRVSKTGFWVAFQQMCSCYQI